MPNIKNVKAMFQPPESSKFSLKTVFKAKLYLWSDADELVPEEGKDEVYDEIMETIRSLEEELDDELEKLKKKIGYVILISS